MSRFNFCFVNIIDQDHWPGRTSHVRLPVCLSVGMSAEISETIKFTKFGLGMQILDVLVLRPLTLTTLKTDYIFVFL